MNSLKYFSHYTKVTLLIVSGPLGNTDLWAEALLSAESTARGRSDVMQGEGIYVYYIQYIDRGAVCPCGRLEL